MPLVLMATAAAFACDKCQNTPPAAGQRVVEYDLHAICDGSVDAGQILEFWGGSHNEATHPGGWRVHLRRPPNDENL